MRNVFGVLIAILLMISVVAGVACFAVQHTVLQEDSLTKSLDKAGAYTALTGELQERLADRIRSSSLYREEYESRIDGVIDDVIREDAVRRDVNDMIGQIFRGEKVTMEGTNIKQDISERVSERLDEEHLGLIPDDMVEKAIDTAVSKAMDDINVTGNLDSVVQRIQSAQNLTSKGLKAAGIASLILLVLGLIVWKKRLGFLGFSLLLSGMLTILSRTIVSRTVSGIDFPADADAEMIRSVVDSLSGMLTSSLLRDGLLIAVVGLVIVILGMILNIRRKRSDATAV